MPTALLPLFTLAISLALIWMPAHFLMTVRHRLRRKGLPIRLSIYRALNAFGWAALIFNIYVVAQIVTGRVPLTIAQNWPFIGSLIIVWATFWARQAIVRMGRKRWVQI